MEFIFPGAVVGEGGGFPIWILRYLGECTFLMHILSKIGLLLRMVLEIHMRIRAGCTTRMANSAVY